MLTKSFQLYSSGPLPVTLSRNTRVLSNNDNDGNKQNNNFTRRAHFLVHFFATSVLWKKVSGLEFGPQAFNSRDI